MILCVCVHVFGVRMRVCVCMSWCVCWMCEHKWSICLESTGVCRCVSLHKCVSVYIGNLSGWT